MAGLEAVEASAVEEPRAGGSMAGISEELKGRIEKKVASLEANTSVEFVPVFARQSSSYRTYRMLLVLGAFTWVYVILSFQEGFVFPVRYLFEALLVSFCVFAALHINAVLRWSLPTALKLRKVESAALRAFLQEEIFKTKDRTGVLVFISELERAVYIVPDQGILAHIPASEWADLGADLARDFQKKCTGETFLKALDSTALKLGQKFPPEGVNENQLSNRLRTEDTQG